MSLVERFLKYVSFDTQSSEETGLTPSTPGQMTFAEYLKSELESLGLEEISLDENGYLFATLPANVDKELPVVGFIAHMDTSPDMSGKDVKPRTVTNYDGTDIVLCAEENIVLSPSRFPELLDHKGEDLIVTDGKRCWVPMIRLVLPRLFRLLSICSNIPKSSMVRYVSGSILTRRSDWELISSM